MQFAQKTENKGSICKNYARCNQNSPSHQLKRFAPILYLKLRTNKKYIMKSNVKYLFTLCLVFSLTFLKAQKCSAVELLNEKQAHCYVMNSETLWNELISEIEQLEGFGENPELKFQWVKSHYGLAGVYMSEYNKEKGPRILEKAVTVNKDLLDSDPNNSDYHAMMSALYGLQMGFSPSKGMLLGPKSDKHVQKSLKLNGENGFAKFQEGSSFFHTPKFFGGSTSKAVASLEKAVALLEAEGDLTSNWIWLEAMTWLGQAYAKNDQKDLAITTYKNALDVFPDYGWIKYSLLPNLNKSNK